MALKGTFRAVAPAGKVLVKCRVCGAEHLLARSSGDPAGSSYGWRLCPTHARSKDAEPERGQFGGDIRWVWPNGAAQASKTIAERDWHRASAECGMRSAECGGNQAGGAAGGGSQSSGTLEAW